MEKLDFAWMMAVQTWLAVHGGYGPEQSARLMGLAVMQGPPELKKRGMDASDIADYFARTASEFVVSRGEQGW
jgi:hypothetical protein